MLKVFDRCALSPLMSLLTTQPETRDFEVHGLQCSIGAPAYLEKGLRFRFGVPIDGLRKSLKRFPDGASQCLLAAGVGIAASQYWEVSRRGE